MKRLLPFILAVLVLVPSLALAEGGNYVSREQIDLLTLLPPPPAQDSAQTKAEFTELLYIQKSRTPEQEAAASADAEETVFRFADVMGPDFTPEKLPVAAAFFKKAGEDEGFIVDPAKDVWKRPRPFMANEEIKPCVKLSKSGAYPSGHTTFGTIMAIILANMVPEKAAEIHQRAEQYGYHRILGGVHYPSDVVAGRKAGTVIAAFMMQNPTFKADFDKAKAEVRQVLGYK